MPKNVDELDPDALAKIQWLINPQLLIETYWGDNLRKKYFEATQRQCPTSVGLTNQQWDLVKLFCLMILAKVKKFYGYKLTPEEKKLVNKKGIIIKSARGLGKDFVIALCHWIFWIVATPKDADDFLILATGPNGRQIKTVLKREIIAMQQLSVKSNDGGKPILEEIYEVQDQKIIIKKQKGWHTELLTPNPKATEKNATESVSGRHAPWMLVIPDEAIGVRRVVLKTLVDTMTSKPVNILLAPYNPTMNKGYIYELEDTGAFVNLHWSAYDSELVTKEEINAYLNDFCGGDIENNAFRINFRGLAPLENKDALFPPETIYDFINNTNNLAIMENGRILQGNDVGGGTNGTCIVTKNEKLITDIQVKKTYLPEECIDFSIKSYAEHKAIRQNVDGNGNGWGIVGAGKNSGRNFITCIGHRSHSEKFPTVRDKLVWDFMQDVINGTTAIVNDNIPQYILERLSDQMMVAKKDDNGKVFKIISKKVMKSDLREAGYKSGDDSPDEFDACCFTYFGEQMAVVSTADIEENVWEPERSRDEWMASI